MSSEADESIDHHAYRVAHIDPPTPSPASGELASLVESINYRVNNPSAWPVGFDEETSELFRLAASQLAAVAAERDALMAERKILISTKREQIDVLTKAKGKLHDYANMRDVQIVTAVEALNKIVDMNVQYAIDRYGDATKADDMSCVTTARKALATLFPGGSNGQG